MNFYILASQILGLSLAIAAFPSLTIGTIVFYNIIIFFYLNYSNQTQKKYSESIINYFFNLIYCIIYNFTYINLKEGKTIIYQFVFYVINFIKVTLFCIIFHLYYNYNFQKNIGWVPLVLYIIGCFCLIFYYCICHPKNKKLQNNDKQIVCGTFHNSPLNDSVNNLLNESEDEPDNKNTKIDYSNIPYIDEEVIES